MDALKLPLNTLHKAEMEGNGKLGHTIGRIQHISLMSRIDICYETCLLSTQTVSPPLPGFQGINHCAKYMASHLYKSILYTYNSYYGSNSIRLTLSGNKVEDYTT